MRETWLFEMPSQPRACTRSSTRRVERLLHRPAARPRARRAHCGGAARAARESSCPPAPWESGGPACPPACPTAEAGTVAAREPLRAALTEARARLPHHFSLHHRLHQHPQPFPQEVQVSVSRLLAHELQKVHPLLGHRRHLLHRLLIGVRMTRWSLFIHDLLLHHSRGLYSYPPRAAVEDLTRRGRCGPPISGRSSRSSSPATSSLRVTTAPHTRRTRRARVR